MVIDKSGRIARSPTREPHLSPERGSVPRIEWPSGWISRRPLPTFLSTERFCLGSTNGTDYYDHTGTGRRTGCGRRARSGREPGDDFVGRGGVRLHPADDRQAIGDARRRGYAGETETRQADEQIRSHPVFDSDTAPHRRYRIISKDDSQRRIYSRVAFQVSVYSVRPWLASVDGAVRTDRWLLFGRRVEVASRSFRPDFV